MSKTAHHICIYGRVQGVGFRPKVYQLAQKNQLKGWVINNSSGVRIHCEASEEETLKFRDTLISQLPPLAVITEVYIEPADWEGLSDFRIRKSDSQGPARVLLTPDVATCVDCQSELLDPTNRRYRYPFITCTNCGPRYSIITGLPYDRPLTSMESFPMCHECDMEYRDPTNRRHYSQTNSCPECRIPLSLLTERGITEDFTRLSHIIDFWNQGKIVAIKGIGGYLLTCDATNSFAIRTLRNRKQRPEKPLAVMYPNQELLKEDTQVSANEARLLESAHAPIVLLEMKSEFLKRPEVRDLTRGLRKLGVMLPYTPLYHLLLQEFGKPVVATSGNLSNSTIVFEDKLAENELLKIADVILMNDRRIVTPQDDGVEQLSRKHEERILLRRSRGLAPSYIHPQLQLKGGIFATGALLKSSFGLTHEGNIYLSQFLGNGIHYEAQQNYESCYRHLQRILSFSPDTIVTDLHPDFHATLFGNELARKSNAKLMHLQHHKAHFYAVLGENSLLNLESPVLGIIWDGLGLGEDHQVWGGELFRFQKGQMDQLDHLDYFPVIAGDKMSNEPRLSAFSLGWNHAGARNLIREKFTEQEIRLYERMREKPSMHCSSMGRLFDAFASLILDQDINHYEAEAAIKLEQVAAMAWYDKGVEPQSYFSEEESLSIVRQLLDGVTKDLEGNCSKDQIALNFHFSLVKYIRYQVADYDIKKLAFSGGVFQNALLIDLIIDELQDSYELYFHKDLPPNDECIAFGQLIWGNAHKLGIFE